MAIEEGNDLRQRLQNLEAGDFLEYSQLFEELEESDISFETKSLYHDSVGWLESWRLGELGEIVIDAMNGDPMVRKAQHVEEACQ